MRRRQAAEPRRGTECLSSRSGCRVPPRDNRARRRSEPNPLFVLPIHGEVLVQPTVGLKMPCQVVVLTLHGEVSAKLTEGLMEPSQGGSYTGRPDVSLSRSRGFR